MVMRVDGNASRVAPANEPPTHDMPSLARSRRLAPLVGAGALLLSALAACGEKTDAPSAPDLGATPTGGIWAGNVVLEGLSGAVRAGNNTTRPVGYAVFATEILPVINWRPCTERTGCPTIAPGERRTIADDDIPGIGDGGRGEVVLYWWHLVEGRDGRVAPDSIREVRTTVR